MVLSLEDPGPRSAIWLSTRIKRFFNLHTNMIEADALNIIQNNAPEDIVVPDTVATPIIDLEASPVSTGEVALNWDAPDDDGGSPITDYHILYQLDSAAGVWTEFSHGNTTTNTVVHSLTSSVSYSFRVLPINAVGHGGFTQTVQETPN